MWRFYWIWCQTIPATSMNGFWNLLNLKETIPTIMYGAKMEPKGRYQTVRYITIPIFKLKWLFLINSLTEN